MAAEDVPRVSALVCTLPRSGSWLLAEYLHNSDRAGTPEEYFRPDYYEWYLSRWGAARTMGMAPHELIDSAFPGVRYVHLVREDTALQALSWYRAIQTDSWFRFHGAQQPCDEQRPDMQEVRWLEDIVVEHAKRWRAYFQAAGVSPLTISF